jgi:hypothetical protein
MTIKQLLKAQISTKARNIVIVLMVTFTAAAIFFLSLYAVNYAHATEDEINNINAGFLLNEAMYAARLTWLEYFYSDNKCIEAVSAPVQNTLIADKNCTVPLKDGTYYVCRTEENYLRLCNDENENLNKKMLENTEFLQYVTVTNSSKDGFNATSGIEWKNKNLTKEIKLAGRFSGE